MGRLLRWWVCGRLNSVDAYPQQQGRGDRNGDGPGEPAAGVGLRRDLPRDERGERDEDALFEAGSGAGVGVGGERGVEQEIESSLSCIARLLFAGVDVGQAFAQNLAGALQTGAHRAFGNGEDGGDFARIEFVESGEHQGQAQFFGQGSIMA